MLLGQHFLILANDEIVELMALLPLFQRLELLEVGNFLMLNEHLVFLGVVHVQFILVGNESLAW